MATREERKVSGVVLLPQHSRWAFILAAGVALLYLALAASSTLVAHARLAPSTERPTSKIHSDDLNLDDSEQHQVNGQRTSLQTYVTPERFIRELPLLQTPGLATDSAKLQTFNTTNNPIEEPPICLTTPFTSRAVRLTSSIDFLPKYRREQGGSGDGIRKRDERLTVDHSTQLRQGLSQLPRLYPPRGSDSQIRSQHLPSVLQGEGERYRFRQGASKSTEQGNRDLWRLGG